MSNRDIEKIDFYDLHSRVDQLERRIERLPSKGFIIAASLFNTIIIALIIIFQASILSFIKAVLPGS